MLRRRWPVLLFALWTGYVWVSRIVNAWSASDEAMTAKVISTVVSVVLVVGAVAVLAVLRRARTRAFEAVEVRLLQTMTIATLVVWAVRVPQILLDGDHNVAFKVVHVTLAVLSLVLAALTWRVAARNDSPAAVGSDRDVSPAVGASR